ncbi:DNA-binding protein [bacterium DOLZORAL124_38_8]|nr:MAG: DNA-binding protein [bacterium DOLZORAL124_38_8]
MAFTKNDMIEKMAEAAGITKKAAGEALNAMLDSVETALAAGGSVTLTGFGTFSVTQRAARTGVNPRTGAAIKIPAKKVAKFKAGKQLREAVA